MTEQEIEINKNRLENLISKYKSDIEKMKNIQWSLIRTRNEIELICKDLGIEVKQNIENENIK